MNIVVLGSTGSIGRQTLEIARDHPDKVTVYGLVAGSNAALLRTQLDLFPTARAVLVDETVDCAPRIARGMSAVIDLVTTDCVELVVVALVGAAGLLPTIAALRAGKRVALANKETLVMAGSVITNLAGTGQLVPIDSEHSAIWQCVQGESHDSIERVVLTASGGALRDLPLEELSTVTPRQALHHPTWNMGKKVTIDSATLMNKGLEVIEATLLFDLPLERVEVILHRQSIVHSLVYFCDTSVKAQLGLPDMRLPIQYALGFPTRWRMTWDPLSLASVGTLTFEELDNHRYPCVGLAIEAASKGGTYCAALCAADEAAVDLFLLGRIPFLAIQEMIRVILEKHENVSNPSVDEILEVDRQTRSECFRLAGVPR